MSSGLFKILLTNYAKTWYSTNKIKNWKAADLNKILPEVWKTRKFDGILLQYCNAIYNQNIIDRWTKSCIFLFSKKSDLGIAKNYQGITLTSIAAKIYNALLLDHIEPEMRKFLGRTKIAFGKIDPWHHKFCQSGECRRCLCKKPWGDTIVCRFLLDIWLQTQRKDGANTSSPKKPLQL